MEEFDEDYFSKRKRRSLQRARQRMQPLNHRQMDDPVLADRQRAHSNLGTSGADISPMAIDTTTTFKHIGGLEHHIQSLKEMIVFPLM